MGNFFREMRDLDKKDEFYDYGGFGRYEFYLFSTCLGVIIAIFSLVGATTGLVQKRGGNGRRKLWRKFFLARV